MHFLLETIRLGLGNLRLHLLRSTLTALGIILGVAAVIVMSSLGEGSKRQALEQLESLGARNVIVRSQKPPETQNLNNNSGRSGGWVSRYGISRETYEVVRANFPDALAIVPLKEIGSQILREERRIPSQAFGTTPDLMRVARLTLAQGRYLTPQDMDQGAMVGVIGNEIAKQLFPFDSPLGRTIRIDDKPIVVVGVLAPIGLSSGAGTALVGRDLNLDVHIPLPAARAGFGDLVRRGSAGSFQNNEVQVSEIYLECPSRERVRPDAQRLTRILQVRNPGLADVAIIVPYELLERAKKTALTYNLVFGAVAGISLLVGGIGIMNIMLASVTERTREIGIRRAIGATRRHILWQFLVETSVLSAIGGIAGVLLGVGGSAFLRWGVPQLPRLPVLGHLFPSDINLPASVTPWSILLSFSVATLTGLAFGLYPARKAARQDPIVALRHD